MQELADENWEVNQTKDWFPFADSKKMTYK